MKKYVYFTLLFLIPILSIAQSRIISGIIKDSETQKPIEAVSISIVGTNQRTLTNIEGEFRISLPQENSQLNFYHLGYNDSDLQVKESLKVEILLTPKVYQLEEVVIGREAELDSLLFAVNNSRNKLEKSLLLNTYYREFTKFDGKSGCFTDGILDYHIFKKTVGKKKKMRDVIASDLYVRQSRVSDLRDENTDEVEMSVLRGWSINDVRTTVRSAYGTDVLKVIRERSLYDFRIVNKTDGEGNTLKTAYFSPKSNIEKEGLFIGSVTYNPKSNLVLDFDLKFSHEHKKYAVMHSRWYIYRFNMKLNDLAIKASFKEDGENYVLMNEKFRMDLYIKIGKKFERTFETVYDLTTLDYKEGIFNLDETKKYTNRTLAENGNNYHEKFWEKLNVVPMSIKEEAIIRELNQKSAAKSSETALK